MISADDCLSFNCPAIPTSGRIRWREYRLISAGMRMSLRFDASRSIKEDEPPAMLGTIEIVSPFFRVVASLPR